MDYQDKHLKGHLALFVAYIIFGLNSPISKSILSLGFITPYALTFFRMLGAAILFWVASLFVPREKVSKRDLVVLFFASLFSLQLNQTFFIVGLSMTSPIDASIVATMVPILTMIFASVFLKEPITLKKAVGVFLGMGGAMLLIINSNYVQGGESNMLGNLICLLSACSFAIYLTVFRGIIMRYSSITLMKWMFLYAVICSIPLCLRDVMRIDPSLLNFSILSRIAFVVLGATFIGYLLIPIGQKRLRPTVVSMYNYLQPVVASIAAVVLGLDKFGFVKCFAAALIFTGVYVVTRSKSRAQLEAEKAARLDSGEDPFPRK